MGEVNLTELLGDATVSVIAALDMSPIAASSLVDLLIQRYGEAGVLQNREVRSALFKSLGRTQAQELCQVLNLDLGSPWTALNRLSPRPGSKSEGIIREVFGVEAPPIGPDEINLPPKVKLIHPEYPLFDHQNDAVERALLALRSKLGRVILHMPTGAGKTRSAMNIICNLFRSDYVSSGVVVWLAHSEELCDQAASEFETAWSKLGNRELPIYRNYGGNRVESFEDANNGFVVMSLQSAYSAAMSSVQDTEFFELGRNTELVILDEAHKATAETYSHVLELLCPSSTSRLLGLTATPGRSWLDVGEDMRLADFFRRQKVTLNIPGYDNPIDYLVDKGYLARVETDVIPYDGGKPLSESELKALSAGRDFPKSVLETIGEDTARNLRIILRAEKEVSDGGSVIVFACSITHAETISTILELRGTSARCVTGATPREQRAEAIRQFKENGISVLCNFGVLTTGFDAPKADVAIIARPTNSLVLYSQMVGRVIRGPLAGGTSNCRVVTVVDQRYGFRNLGEAFTYWDDLWEEKTTDV